MLRDCMFMAGKNKSPDRTAMLCCECLVNTYFYCLCDILFAAGDHGVLQVQRFGASARYPAAQKLGFCNDHACPFIGSCQMC